MPKANNGVDRGTCTRPLNHAGRCRNDFCTGCGVACTSENTYQFVLARRTGQCIGCHLDRESRKRRQAGRKLAKRQILGAAFTFDACGCTSILPLKRESNKFVVARASSPHRERQFRCRIEIILRASRQGALHYGYVPIDPDTPHDVIRKLMEEPNCWRCNALLNWANLGRAKTPHLHHNHSTGEIYGFTCAVCNPHAEEEAFDRLYDENVRLKYEIRKLQTAKAA